MKVVDASVIVDLVSGLLQPETLGDEPLAAPHLLDSDVLHALRGRVFGGRLSERDATLALGAFDALVIKRYPAAGLHDRIWELRRNLTAYEATYVALAEALGVTSLLTRDGPLTQVPGIRCRVAVV